MTDRIRSFRALVVAQFFGAFNDNLFKQLVLFLAASTLFPGQDLQGLAFAVFSLPFVLLSGFAGDLSERVSKPKVIRAMKAVEIALMLAGTVTLALQSFAGLLTVLFGMGVHSALFGPSKYGVVPELVPPDRLMRANGTIAMTTFLSVLLGQALAGPLMDGFGERLYVPGLVCVLFAVVGFAFAQKMGPLPAQRPDLTLHKNPFGRLFETMAVLKQRQGLMAVVVLHSVFWFDGGVLQQAIVALGEPGYLNVGDGEKRLLSYLMVTLAVSIMAGTLIAPRLERRPDRRGLTLGQMATLGALGMIAGQLALLLIGPVLTRATGGFAFAHAALAVVGFAGAFFVVPIQTYLQDAPPPGLKGRTFAVNNFMNFLFIFLGGAWFLVARADFGLGLSPGLTQAIAALFLLGLLVRNRRTIAALSLTEPR